VDTGPQPVVITDPLDDDDIFAFEGTGERRRKKDTQPFVPVI